MRTGPTVEELSTTIVSSTEPNAAPQNCRPSSVAWKPGVPRRVVHSSQAIAAELSDPVGTVDQSTVNGSYVIRSRDVPATSIRDTVERTIGGEPDTSTS